MINQLGIHETLETHEILILKNLSLTKAATMSGLVQDPQLQELLSHGTSMETRHIKQLKSILLKSRGEQT